MAKLPSSSSFGLHFLRRLLCAHSTTGNADTPQRDADALGHMSVPEEQEGRSPCIVARLMGLDAMPAAEAGPRQKLLLRRSRSASSADWGRSPCGGLGLSGDYSPDAPAASAVPASASLREKTAYLREENDMFLLLSFSPEERGTAKKEKADDDRENRPRPGGGDKKQRRPHRRKLQFGDDDEESGRGRECNAQSSSSPVSVLEARDVHEDSSTTTTTTSSSLEDAEPCSATSEEAHFASDQQSSTRKQHTSFVQLELDDMSPATSTVHASRCSDRNRRKRRTVNRSDMIAPDVSGIWQPVCRLVEEDLKSTEWLSRDGANVVAEMDSDILDQLICEATVELMKLTSDPALPSPMPKKCSGKTREARPRNIQPHRSHCEIGSQLV